MAHIGTRVDQEEHVRDDDFPLISIIADGNNDPALVGSPSVDIIAKRELQGLLNVNDRVSTAATTSSISWGESSSDIDMKVCDILHPFHGGSIDFDAAARRCFTHPHEAQALIQGKSMLQVAITANAPYHVISALLRAYPRMCLRSAYATSALFDACRCNAQPDIIELILQTMLEECHRAGVVRNFSPFTWISDMSVSLEQARLLLTMHPDGAVVKDDYLGKINALNQAIDDFEWKIHEVVEYDSNDGSESLNSAYAKLQLLLEAKDTSTSAVHINPLASLLNYCLYDESAKTETSSSGYHPQGFLTIVAYISKVEPEQFGVLNDAGDLPLHVIAKMKQSGLASKTMESLIRLVLEVCPRASLVEDADGRLPIHLVTSNQARVGSASCQLLALAAPQALSIIDGKVGLYPFQAAAMQIGDEGILSSDTSQLSLVYNLLRGAPDVLGHDASTMGRKKNKGGNIITSCATCTEKDDDVARFKKELELLRESMILLERENLQLKGYAGEFGSPGNRKRRSAWV